MNYRTLKILELIFVQEKEVTVSKLAAEWKVSERTIYSDLNSLTDFLLKYSVDGYELRDGLISFDRGNLPDEIVLSIEREFQRLLSEAQQYDPKFRVKYIGFLILFYRNTTTNAISKELSISTSTVKSDYKKLEKELHAFNLVLHTQKFKGVTILGNESDKRNFLIEILLNDYLLDDPESIDNFYQQYLDVRLLDRSMELLEEFSQRLNIQYVDKYATYLYIAIYISLNRMQQGNFIEEVYVKSDKIYNRKESTLVEEYLKNSEIMDERMLEQIDFKAEVRFILDKIQTSSYYGHVEDFNFDNWLNLQFMVDRLIVSVSNECSPRRISDRQLYEELMQHLRPALNRLKKNIKYENPLKDEIQERFLHLTRAVKQNIHSIENYYKVVFSADELSYLVLLFAASMKRNEVNNGRVSNVAVVCQEGISTSSILRSQLEQQFNIDVIDIYSKYRFEQNQPKHNYDYIISTIDLDIPHFEYLKVNTILSSEDKIKLTNLFAHNKRQVNLQEVIEKIKPYIRVIDEENLYKELGKIIGVKDTGHVNVEENEIMLSDVLVEKSIELGKKLSNAEEAVRFTGEVLKRQGLIEDSYTEAMVKNMKDNGPYFVIAPGIAMPHARPDAGAKGIGFSIVTLAEPVEFGHPKNDPVELIIGLCAIDHQSHLNALQELMEILSVEENLEQIKNAKNKNEVLNILRKESSL